MRHIDFDNCPTCGDELAASTDDSVEDGYFQDGDEVRCLSCDKRVGQMVADGERCYVAMDDEEL